MDEVGKGYSLEPYTSGSGYYTGDDDGGKEYQLPEGYSVTQTEYSGEAIFDADSSHCSIMVHSSGRPQLVSSGQKMPVLSEVTNKALG